MAWSPILGVHDVRYASELPPFGPIIDTQEDYYGDADLDYDSDHTLLDFV